MDDKKVPLKISHRRTFGSRSRKGCRTCRARHVKCDEAPGVCKNCIFSGRKCEYDIHRLPAKPKLHLPRALLARGWIMTSDEKRCFSYFQYHMVPSLVEFFDSSLWEKHILPMSYTEPAVSHAVSMLSAIHQGAEALNMRLVGKNTHDSELNFALEQGARTCNLLSTRRASRDPQLYETVLTCCLLFVIAEFMLSRYDIAFMHIHHGVQLIKEAWVQNIPPHQSLVGVFAHLSVEVAMYVADGPPQILVDSSGPEWPQVSPLAFQNLREARIAFDAIMNCGIAFISQSWRMSDSEVIANYDSLWLARQRILARYSSFKKVFEPFYATWYPKWSLKSQRAADIIRIHHLTQISTLKMCLPAEDYPEDCLTSDCATILSASIAVMKSFPKRVSFTLDSGIIPGLYLVAARCPDFSIRVQAIQALHAWPHIEGVINSEITVGLALEAFKADIQNLSHEEALKLSIEIPKEPDQFLIEVVTATRNVADWSPIRFSRLKCW
ncbi:hypothetical protein BO71DRAFT_351200 [Aspergillus ellipticus CBS 707.79]|uniref:Zn(2)-C6 fungal-type domain-containing protein n=1 Tax=Aspergillus ellipticus CBS 707.79 TaxID=1448320 RepID=A0A319DDN8_9EURO|nr:hypothetical protein BO71DRAFT_351200 [Aspergillus ellipticus CBS 707.79]